MTKVAMIIVGLMFSVTSLMNAQTTENTKVEAENEGWLTNLDEAYKLSQESGKPILANFTGSDWCGWCKKLTADAFSKEEFKKWAAENVILLEVDFPRRKKLPAELVQQNGKLQRTFGVRGYPTIHIFDVTKDKNTGAYSFTNHGKTGYPPQTTADKVCSKFISQLELIMKEAKTK